MLGILRGRAPHWHYIISYAHSNLHTRYISLLSIRDVTVPAYNSFLYITTHLPVSRTELHTLFPNCLRNVQNTERETKF